MVQIKEVPTRMHEARVRISVAERDESGDGRERRCMDIDSLGPGLEIMAFLLQILNANGKATLPPSCDSSFMPFQSAVFLPRTRAPCWCICGKQVGYVTID